MSTRLLTATILAAAMLVPAVAPAKAPLRETAAEVVGTSDGAELRVEAGDRSRAGIFVGYGAPGQSLSFGPTIAYVAVRHRAYELRGYTRLSLTRFTTEPAGWVFGSRIGARSVLRGRYLGFWLGPYLDAAAGLSGDTQQRLTPGLGTGIGGGPAEPWPWLWASVDLGYSSGGTGRGAVATAWYLSLVFER